MVHIGLGLLRQTQVFWFTMFVEVKNHWMVHSVVRFPSPDLDVCCGCGNDSC